MVEVQACGGAVSFDGTEEERRQVQRGAADSGPSTRDLLCFCYHCAKATSSEPST